MELNKLGRVNLVLSRDGKDSLKYLVTDLVSTPAMLVVKRYDLRWNIECYFRDIKQHLGLGEYQMRSLHGIVRHLYIVMISYILLVHVKFLSRYIPQDYWGCMPLCYFSYDERSNQLDYKPMQNKNRIALGTH